MRSEDGSIEITMLGSNHVLSWTKWMVGVCLLSFFKAEKWGGGVDLGFFSPGMILVVPGGLECVSLPFPHTI